MSKEVKALECEISLLKKIAHERIVQYLGTSQLDHELAILMGKGTKSAVKQYLLISYFISLGISFLLAEIKKLYASQNSTSSSSLVTL